MEPDYNDDLTLATGIKEGNELAFNHLFRTRYERACRLAAAITNDNAAAEDIVQEVFSSIWQRAPRLDDRKPVDNYLFASIRNACLNHLRDHPPRSRVDISSQESLPAPPPPPEEDPRIARLRRAIDHLPPRCRLIFTLVAWEEMTYQEVSDRLDVSLNTVKTQVKIAYRTLRDELNAPLPSPPKYSPRQQPTTRAGSLSTA
ncbi:MAG: RNA polymerase sigma-70 factor [Odoribacteraceae bacterium]|jgi:RNA polymerase sigma-70 factor (ECF subfamily)|nr:RNA polymerase sigma-70 factor [Odoribacteraceae bacterium]